MIEKEVVFSLVDMNWHKDVVVYVFLWKQNA